MKSMSLIAALLIATFLDMVPIGGSCSDNHSRGGRRDNHSEETANVVVTGNAVVDESGCQLRGFVYLDLLPPYLSMLEYGIEYAEKGEDGNLDFKKVAAADAADDGTFSVKLDDLKPSTIYVYRAYLLCANNSVYYGQNRSFQTEDAE